MTLKHIKASPAPFPQGGDLDPVRTALLVIDMQRDFCAADGYMHRLGCDLARLRAPIEPLRRVLDAARSAGLTVIHTREGYAPDLSDLQPWKKAGATNEAIGSRGLLGRALVRGEFGWDFIDELQPESGEAVYDKSSYGAFVTTTLGADLKAKGIDTAILTGVTTDCCITSSLREALDRGIDCMVVEDCVTTGSAERHEAALTIIRAASGVFGTLGQSNDVVAALTAN
jgi:nicotinamidase-related amidase